MRGLASSGIAVVPSDVHVLLEHSNRGKKSLGLDLSSAEGVDILYRLAATCDVFLTNKLPRVRRKLKIDVGDIRAHNPHIVYVRGTGQGERGPDADKGSYDSLAFWNRAGVALALMRPEYSQVPGPPGPGFGDSIGAMTIAGGIMGALFHRERTGEATTVDVSLLSAGMWAMGQTLSLSLQMNRPWAPPPPDQARANPLTANYQTKDGRWLAFTCLQAGQYWPDMCRVLGRPDLAADPRFADHSSLISNGMAAIAILREIFAEQSLADWREKLADFTGQWAVAQDTTEVAVDAQTIANTYMQECHTSAGAAFQLVTAPVQFGEEPAAAGRAPEMNEHGDEILSQLGFDLDATLDLKVRGVVA
jgi:crotonobetainyl-CoA:carnitine CoA-transferase CaiB-like acyl-CoA transferase